MSKKFSELREKMPQAAQARAAARAQALLLEMQLRELRKTRNATQADVARVMQVEQTSISKLERRDDMYVSTLRQYVQALGGELQLLATFPDAQIRLHPLDAPG